MVHSIMRLTVVENLPTLGHRVVHARPRGHHAHAYTGGLSIERGQPYRTVTHSAPTDTTHSGQQQQQQQTTAATHIFMAQII